MVRLVAGADPAEVKQRLTEALRSGSPTSHNAGGDDVMVMTKDEFREQERHVLAGPARRSASSSAWVWSWA